MKFLLMSLISHRPDPISQGKKCPADRKPEQVIDKVGRYHQQFGHEVIHLSADADAGHSAAATQ